MTRYGRDFMGRMRGMWDRFSDGLPRRGGGRRHPSEAMGPGGEGYFLTHDMARHASYNLDYTDAGWDDGRAYGDPDGGMAQFGRAGAGRGYGGDYRTGRGGYDAGEFFVNRTHGGGTGYHPGYGRDVGMRGGMARGGPGMGYGADYGRGGFPGYDRGYRGGFMDRGRGYGGDYRGWNRTPPPYTRGR